MALFPRARKFKRPLPSFVAPLVVPTILPVAPEYAAEVGPTPPTAPTIPAKATITDDSEPAFAHHPLYGARKDH